jgi:hypothetical protein
MRARILAGEEPGWLKVHPRRDYIVALCLATPPWVSTRAIRALDKRARHLSRVRGRRHVVDHVIPITNGYVCGLNWHGNMEILEEHLNQKKGNRWPPQLELLAEPEQLSL